MFNKCEKVFFSPIHKSVLNLVKIVTENLDGMEWELILNLEDPCESI